MILIPHTTHTPIHTTRTKTFKISNGRIDWMRSVFLAVGARETDLHVADL